MKPDSLNILVIDDSETAREALLGVLEELGHQATLVESGRAALDRLAADTFDLIICDLVMPELDGIDVLNQARAAGVEAPFLLVTANATLKSVVAALRQGAQDYIIKPINLDLLSRRIESAMDSLQLARERAAAERLQGAPGHGRHRRS